MMIDESKINNIVNRIAKEYDPAKVILFGSYANGNYTQNSDLDLLIIKDTDLPKQKRNFDIYKLLRGSMIPIDILVYTQSEFDEENLNKYSFLHSAIKNSKIMYERKT